MSAVLAACLAGCWCLPSPAHAQTADYWLNQISRSLSLEKKKNRRRQRKDGAGTRNAELPPLPQRRPRYELLDGRYQVVPANRNADLKIKHAPEPIQGTAKTAVPPQNTPQPPPEPPKTNGWSNAEIDAALGECVAIVKRYNAVALPEAPIRDGECGTPAPVSLHSIFSGKDQVIFSPPVTVNCRVIAAVGDWLREDLQPLAKRLFSSKISRVTTMSSYSCRNAYGRISARLSEHSFANALDIRGFELASGKSANLLEDWGATARDVRKRLLAERAAAEKIRREEEARRIASKRSGPEITRPGQPTAPNKGDGSTGGAGGKFAGIPPPEKNPKPKMANAAEIDLGEVVSPPPTTAAGRFLRAAHTAACKHFGTVLGPEVNEAHRNHFHVDLAPRKRSNYCR
jgi:hypothetical protein